MLRNHHSRALSLIEVLVAFLVLLVAVLTLVGYTTTIHRAAKEGKRQALASMEARSMLERIRDAPSAFAQAVTPEGLSETKLEYLLDSESDETKNEAGRMAAAQFRVLGRAEQVAGEIYRVVVAVQWAEDGRERQVVLESRMVRTDF
jgi:type IV pilus modification protein PilV